MVLDNIDCEDLFWAKMGDQRLVNCDNGGNMDSFGTLYYAEVT
jgi:hypothetical protein